MPEQFWFGTEQHAEWLEVPQTGADMSAQDWNAEADFLSGRGMVHSSWMSARGFQFTWGAGNSIGLADKVHNYANGLYGRGLLYFVDPLLYDSNTLPPHWADPSMAVGRGASPLLVDWYPIGENTVVNSKALPVVSAKYEITDLLPGFDVSRNNTLFVPKPDGYGLALGAFYSANVYAGIYVTPVFKDGSEGDWQRLTEVGVTDGDIVPDLFTDSNLAGVRLWIGKGYENETNTVTNPSFESTDGVVVTPWGTFPAVTGVDVSDPTSVLAWQSVDAKLYGDNGLVVQWADTRLSLTTQTDVGLYDTSVSAPYDVEGFDTIGLYGVRPEGDLVSVGDGFWEIS